MLDFYFSIYFLLTISFNAFPALKVGALQAGIIISSLVCGLRPFLAALVFVSKEPKPTSWTFSPFTKASVTVYEKALIISEETFLEYPVFEAIELIKSALFIFISLLPYLINLLLLMIMYQNK